MGFIAITFRSRAHTVKFSEILRRNGISNEIINTPKEAEVGCGLSVKISPSNFLFAKRLVKSSAFSSFAGFFLIKLYAGRRIVKSI